jgi:hypothetical protein
MSIKEDEKRYIRAEILKLFRIDCLTKQIQKMRD